MQKKILLGNDAIIQGALASGVSYVSGYPGCPSAEIGDNFAKIAKDYGVYVEWATNEKVGLESAIGASFSGLRALVNMKSFGINVCSDSLLPLAYTGVKGGLVVVVADDPSCWSSAQTEQNSLGYAYMSHIPTLEPDSPQECYDFTKLAFEISEKFSTPVILHTVTRVNHQKMPVVFEETKMGGQFKAGNFVKDPHRFTTMPPRVMEQKKELLEKIKKIQAFAEKSKINFSEGKQGKIGIIVSGVSYLHVKEALEVLKITCLPAGRDLPILKLGFFYPLPIDKIKKFIKPLKKLLVVEELDDYLEKELNILAKDVNPKLQILGKELLSKIGELNTEKVLVAIAKIANKKYKGFQALSSKLQVPNRTAKLCQGCPYWYIFPTLKKIAPDAIFTGDIGCNMIAGLSPHNIQDTLFSMGASVGVAHGVSKSTGQKVIAIMGDGTFFHAGMPAVLNAVYNKSNPLIVILDNRITAMTGHQTNPGMGKTIMGEDTIETNIEAVIKAFGVKNIKVLDPIDMDDLANTAKEFLAKNEVSVIICKRICALLERRQTKK